MPLALADAVGGLADAGALSVRARAARERLDRLAVTAPAVSDPAAPLPLPDGHGVVVHGAELGWTDRPALALDHLVLRPGEHLGITGPSGSGKSTLAATLVRFIDPVSGEVLLDGTDLRRLALDDVRRRVGLVDDDPHVFASTVAENVRLARPDADDDEVRAALDRACLGPWVDGTARRHPHPRRCGPTRGVRRRARAPGAGTLAAGGPAGARARRADRPPRRAHRAGRR